MKEILITKERNNEKFQEFRKMILENLAIVLKIICGDKFLIHKFDTKDYMDYEPKFVTKEEYAMNMVERDLHEVYNIMTQGYTEVCNGGSIEKRYLTDKYNVSTLVSTETKTKNNTQEIKMKDGKEKMVRNVRVLEESVEKGLLQGYALESAKQTLEKIDHRTTGVDTWVLENNEGTYGTEIVITKDGHIDLYLCIMEKYSSRVSYIRVGNFQPEFGLGDIWLPNGEIKEYQKLGTIINTLNKVYEKYGFYFTADTKNNRRILADARKSYELFKAEEKERKRKENLVKDLVSLSGSTLCGLLRELGHEGRVFYEDTEELERELVKFFEESDKKYDCWQDVFADYKENYLEVERLKKNLVKKEQELLSKEVTFDIDGEGKVEEIKDASYADANENYKRRRYQAPEKGNGYNKTYVTMKLDGKKFHDMVICLHGETEHHNLKDAILAQIKVLRKTWVEGDGVPYFKPEKNKEIIEKKYGSKEKLAIALDAKEMVVRNLGIESEIVIETHTEKMEEKQMNTINKNALTNRMTKLGEFLKENRDKDAVENKVLELFPKAMEVEVFEGDNVVHFLVGQEYVGKAPTKKEMKELDWEYRETIQTYGLTLYVAVESDKIKMDAHIAVDYRDRHGCPNNIDFTVKELEIELELTMEVAKELAEETRNKHNNGELSPCYAWNKINDLTNRKTTDEVLEFLKGEIQYYDKKEQEEREQRNITYIDDTINKSYQLFAEGTISAGKILEKLKRLENYCHNYALLDKVRKVIALFEKAEDRMWREVVRKEVTQILEGKYEKMLQEKIDILKKEVTKETTADDAKEILGKLGKHIKQLYDIKHKGFCYETEPLLVTCFGIGGKENIPTGCDRVIHTRRLRYGIHLSESEEFISMYAIGDILVEKDGDEWLYENRRLFYKEIPFDIEPEPEEIDELEKNIKDHINSVLDLMDNIEKEKFEYMYKKTVAVKRNDRYELTSSLEDVWTGLTVYVGDSSNVLMIPNSEKSFLTDIVEDFLCSNIGINETVEKIKEKIKRKFEYSYSKSVTVKEEEQIYVLETPSGVELFWYYKDAYSRMVELVNEMSERFSNNYEVIIEDYSARMETFSWRIIEKNIK